MKRRFFNAALGGLLLIPPGAYTFAAEETAVAPTEKPAAPAEPRDGKIVELPKDIVWETNNDEPLIGSPNAIRGGRLTLGLGTYPLTFRLMGPNANDSFASWNRKFAMMELGLAAMHPVTDKYIPILATHWSVQKDQRTIFFKLDRDAKWSDGKPVIADDYVFTMKMMRAKEILDPFYNLYSDRYYESVDKVDDYTLRIVGTRPSWRPLFDYGLFPTPAHTTVIDKDWVDRTTNQPLIVPGPYVISDTARGESITFKRIPNWWGDKKRYFQGLNNFDEIHLRVLPIEREIDYVRQGELDLTMVSSKVWYEGLDFPAVQNGWLRKARIFTETPSGLHGFFMNLQAPIFQNRDFRIAMQYLLNFDRINRNLMYNSFYRKRSFFDGTEFANPDVKSYGFDPAKAREHLERAGYRRPDALAQDTWSKVRNAVRGLIFTRSDTDDILVNDKGEKATFTVLYSGKTYERHFTVMQQDFRRAGVDMRLQVLDSGTRFERALERKYEVVHIAMTTNLYPDPRQYLHSEFKPSANNNNFWGYGSQRVDDLIKIYEESLDPEARREAMYGIDQIMHDEAIYLPFWDAPYMRVLYWDYLQFPEFYLPRRSEQVTDWLVYWIDPVKKAKLEEAKRNNTAYPLDTEVDKDFYHVRDKLQ